MSNIVPDPVSGGYLDRDTLSAVPAPPTRRYRYTVGARPLRIEMTVFPPGAELGTGTVTRDYHPCSLCEFTPAEGLSPHLLVGQGHIYARLLDGRIVAEPIGGE